MKDPDYDCVFCGDEECDCEAYDVYEDYSGTHDEYAELTGFIESKTIRLYCKGFHPTSEKVHGVKLPALIFEEIDHEMVDQDGERIMKAVDYINLSEEDARKIVDFVKEVDE